MSFAFRIVVVLVAKTLTFASAGAVAASWLPLCPERTECATTFSPFVGGGKVLISSSTNVGPNYWIDPIERTAVQTPMHLASVQLSMGYMSVDLTGGNVYDANGQPLYRFNHTGFGPEVSGYNLETLGPAINLGGTVVTGVAFPGSLPKIYQSRDDGRTWLAQTANVDMRSLYANGIVRSPRSNFVASVGSPAVWVVPGPVTPGLWRTPTRADSTEPLDFTRLSRIDDGSFPANVFKLRSWQTTVFQPDGYMVALSSDGMYTSTNSGRTWSRGTFDGIVDDLDSVRQVQPFLVLPINQVIAARGGVFISRDTGQTWAPFARGLPYDRYSINQFNSAGANSVIAAGAGGIFFCRNLACDGTGFGKVDTLGTSFAKVVEFYSPLLDHYFITGDESEKRAVRGGGAGPGWIETGDTFFAWSPEWRLESVYVCRFYGDFQHGPNSHFFTASMNECGGLLTLQDTGPQRQARWVSEGYAFKVALPNSAGECALGLVPIYRAYNNGYARGVESNHRFVSRRELLAPLISKGWTLEGVSFCTPASAN